MNIHYVIAQHMIQAIDVPNHAFCISWILLLRQCRILVATHACACSHQSSIPTLWGSRLQPFKTVWQIDFFLRLHASCTCFLVMNLSRENRHRFTYSPTISSCLVGANFLCRLEDPLAVLTEKGVEMDDVSSSSSSCILLLLCVLFLLLSYLSLPSLVVLFSVGSHGGRDTRGRKASCDWVWWIFGDIVKDAGKGDIAPPLWCWGERTSWDVCKALLFVVVVLRLLPLGEGDIPKTVALAWWTCCGLGEVALVAVLWEDDDMVGQGTNLGGYWMDMATPGRDREESTILVCCLLCKFGTVNCANCWWSSEPQPAAAGGVDFSAGS